MPSLSPLLSIMTRAAEKAAKSLLRDFGEVEQLQVSVKGPGDFVSAADRRAEEILYAELSKARPGYAFLMEESGAKGPADAEFRFIIDPLDGTSNFLHGIPHWAISIGLEKNGEMVAGVVYDAVKNEMFYAEKGGGAYMNDRRIRVSGRKELNNAMTGISGYMPWHKDFAKYSALMQKICGSYYRFRSTGSMALDLAYVSCGRFDSHIQTDYSLWDAAAGLVLIKEAGGVIHDAPSLSLIHDKAGIVASNLHLMPHIRTLLEV
jgi:myo-inositol-1(or 4)-monophosphatase